VRLTFALVAAAVSIGSVHTLAPDHWVPFAALARAEKWSARRTALVTAACGLGHVTASVALGLLALFFGLELLQAFGQRLESIAGLLLIGFGVAYGAWGLHRTVSARAHEHAHTHGHTHAHLIPHEHVVQAFRPAVHGGSEGPPYRSTAHRPLTAWTLFLLFSADPCVAVIPLLFTAAPLGWASALAVVAAYELATIATMVVLVLPTRAVAANISGAWADRWGDALAGGVVATVGLAVVLLGM
jgi:nickel/cobalt transporter (NicO) family protein